MSIKKTIGGDRLGAGKKMKTDLKSYNRSTFDTSRIWRSTMSAGTLVPFLSRPILPGSTWDINLDVLGMTHPTIGPLMGSYKIQLDIFLCPMRNYIARLHNNESGLGMNMKDVYIPQYEFEVKVKNDDIDDNSQVNPSSIFAYLGMRGAGRSKTDNQTIKREFNAIPFLAYWEIFKNYYANQQEEIGYVIHNSPSDAELLEAKINGLTWTEEGVQLEIDRTEAHETTEIQIEFTFPMNNEQVETIQIYVVSGGVHRLVPAINIWENYSISGDTVSFYTIKNEYIGRTLSGINTSAISENEPRLWEFDLSNIDAMKRQILQHPYESPLMINRSSLQPYNLPLSVNADSSKTSALFTQEGLAVKTYQNDIFNNWMNSDWIDGENGINSITAVQIVDDKLEIPSLILARKVFNVLNRIALSGGTYDDWLEVTYDHERTRRFESPAYMGGLIKELTFEQVVSNAESGDQPLGTLAGKGEMGGKHVGGHVTVKSDEPAYVIGIVSLTPRIDYSQGNEWDVNLKTVDDLHKPELDAIGFQDLITDEMAWWDTEVDHTTGEVIFKSAGKQPAWINYQTSVNKTYGNFAIEEDQMWMTLNRKYEYDSTKGIADLTSYIDPKKYNNIFAYTRRDAQNFWVQISIDVKARQKMSSKVMPNL